jgi:hypothetical protein
LVRFKISGAHAASQSRLAAAGFMGESRTVEEWNNRWDAVNTAAYGTLPPWWNDVIVASGLMRRTLHETGDPHFN